MLKNMLGIDPAEIQRRISELEKTVIEFRDTMVETRDLCRAIMEKINAE